MAFQVRGSIQTAGDRAGEVFELTDAIESVRAEIWPHWGFNCLRWQVRDPTSDRLADILHVAPDWEANSVPTRSGHPVLAPFPGRLRSGTFTFEGRRYALPKNDSTRQHSIHGFTPRNRWRVTHTSADSHFASVTGEFALGQDLPDSLSLWPADFRLVVTYTLFHDRLRVDARVENLGSGPLPFGLGYHPYFQLPGASDPDIGRYVLKVNAGEFWESLDLLPTGPRRPVPQEIDFREPRSIAITELDHVLTGLHINGVPEGNLINLAELTHPDSSSRLRLLADASFREVVLFSPPHRRAIAIEPYTCSPDAANLAERGIDSGWLVIAAGGAWEAAVEYHWVPRA